MPQDLTSFQFFSFNDIEKKIRLRYLPLSSSLFPQMASCYDSEYSKSTNSVNAGQEAFMSRIERTIQDFSSVYPKILHVDVSFLECLGPVPYATRDGAYGRYRYKFNENWKEVLKGMIGVESLILSPMNVMGISLYRSFETNPSFYSFDKMTKELHIIQQTGVVQYTASYPYQMRVSDDGNFSEDSGVFFIDRPDMFIDYAAKEILSHIRMITQSVTLPGVQPILNLDMAIQEIDTKLESRKQSATAVMFASQW